MQQGFITYTKIKKKTFPNASLEAHQKATNVVTSTFCGFSYEHYLYSFLCKERKHWIHQYLHDYSLQFSVHKIVYFS